MKDLTRENLTFILTCFNNNSGNCLIGVSTNGGRSHRHAQVCSVGPLQPLLSAVYQGWWGETVEKIEVQNVYVYGTQKYTEYKVLFYETTTTPVIINEMVIIFISFLKTTVLRGREETSGTLWYHHRQQLFHGDQKHRIQASRWASCYTDLASYLLHKYKLVFSQDHTSSNWMPTTQKYHNTS